MLKKCVSTEIVTEESAKKQDNTSFSRSPKVNNYNTFGLFILYFITNKN